MWSLKSHLNTQTNSYWSADNPRLIHEVPIRDIRVGIWCAVSATRIMRPNSLNTINSEGYNGQFLLSFLGRFKWWEWIFFRPAGGTTHATNNSTGDTRFVAANNMSSFVAYSFTRSDAMSLFYADDSDNFHKNHTHRGRP